MRPTIMLSLLTLGACATQPPPDRVFAVFFQTFSAQLDAPAQAVVARAASSSKAYPGRVVHVIGYADGDAVANAANISRQRADAVSLQLQTDGVSASLIQTVAGASPPDSQPGIERRRAEIDIDAP